MLCCAAPQDDLGFTAIDVGTLVKEHGFHAGRDSEFDTLVLDEDAEDKLLDHMEPLMAAGGAVVEFHSVGLFPERWFDLVLVLRANNTVLYDRLKARCVRRRALRWFLWAVIVLGAITHQLYRPPPSLRLANKTTAEATPTRKSQKTWSAKSCKWWWRRLGKATMKPSCMNCPATPWMI